MATPADVLSALRELANAKQLDGGELVDLLQDGIQAALQRRYGPTVNAEIEIDEIKGIIKVTVLRRVIEEVEDPASQISLEEARWEDPDFQVGEVLEEEVPFEDFGRSAVQAAKQRIIQRVREGERSRIREEFSGQVGELLSGEIQQIDRGKLVIMLNQFREAEAIVPYREQNRREHFHQGDTIRAVLKRLEETPRGPRLILSRADAAFVSALFYLEVPEIQQGIVDVRSAAREVGARTKIAVASKDDSVDPVGACVGLKGSRVQAVVNELGGERIDIVPWSPDPERFARMALAPARVSRVFFDSEAGAIQAVVDEDQLSLAIGKHGQNVRLASELTGWKIDLFSSREWVDRGGEGPVFAPLEPAEDLVADVELSELKGFPPELVQTLQTAGFQSLRDILDLERADVLAIDGMSDEHVDILMGFLSEVTEENVPAPEDGIGADAAVEAPAEDAAVETPAEDAAVETAADDAAAAAPADNAAEAEPAEMDAPNPPADDVVDEVESEAAGEAEATAEDDAAPETTEESDTEPEPTPAA
ncbi:MAG: transcription termination factor NusA [Gemmatimonadetes bacterium]|nr:transcription termination factor NusA [Gemmatimonadota bacterium]